MTHIYLSSFLLRVEWPLGRVSFVLLERLEMWFCSIWLG